MELKEQRRDLSELVRRYEDQPFVQISTHREIHALTKSILELYQMLPLMVNNGNTFYESDYEDTTGKFPELAA
jgi:hypothetical protein